MAGVPVSRVTAYLASSLLGNATVSPHHELHILGSDLGKDGVISPHSSGPRLGIKSQLCLWRPREAQFSVSRMGGHSGLPTGPMAAPREPTSAAPWPPERPCFLAVVLEGPWPVLECAEGGSRIASRRWQSRPSRGPQAPSAAWQPASTHGPPCRQVHVGGSLAVLGGKLYVSGGYDNTFELSDVVEAYDPETRAWSVVGRLPEPTFLAQLCCKPW